LVSTRQALPAGWSDPRIRTSVEVAGFVGTLVGLYQFFGAPVTFAGGVGILAYYAVQRYRALRRLQDTPRVLMAELPNHHAFLVEFLRETYSLPRDEILLGRNQGLTIHHYENSFTVEGTDCANRQRIAGRNTGQAPSRGLAFALVGGSSLNASDLGAEYSPTSQSGRQPEFLVDRDRFKIAFCEFDRPIAQDEKFEIAYKDCWRGSMRRGADGFFFPEPLFFPGGIHRLSTRLDFSFPIRSMAVLSVNIEDGTVRPCGSQPRPVDATPSERHVFEWEIDGPRKDTIYVLYYTAAE